MLKAQFICLIVITQSLIRPAKSFTFRYVFKPNTTDAEEIAAHFQKANISLVDVTCDIVVIGKLQEMCRPIKVN